MECNEREGGLGTDTTQQASYQKDFNTTLLQCLKSTAAFKCQSCKQKQGLIYKAKSFK